MMRKRIYEIIEPSRNGDKPSLAYDLFMLLAITVSIIPLMFVEDLKAFRVIEQITVTIFILDYLLRWITADFRLGKKAWSFVLYPFTGWAIIDLLSILPVLSVLGKGFKILRLTRLLRILRLDPVYRKDSSLGQGHPKGEARTAHRTWNRRVLCFPHGSYHVQC